MRWLTVIAGTLGVAVAVFIVLHEGAERIFHVLAVGGWKLLWLAPFHVIPIALDAVGWFWLLRERREVGIAFLTWIALLRETINALLPVARIGGEVVGIRLVALRGVPAALVTASVIVELTLTLFSQCFFTLVGLGILIWVAGGGETALIVFLFTFGAAVVALIFATLQRHGRPFERLGGVGQRLLGDRLEMMGDISQVDHSLRRLYDRLRVLIVSAAWQVAGLLVGAVEVWLALVFLGHRVTVADAILIESLGQALRSAAFIVPAGLGVQEAGLVLFGHLVGLPADVSIALSLVKRLREIVLGIPVLISWQLFEGRRAWLHTAK